MPPDVYAVANLPRSELKWANDSVATRSVPLDRVVIGETCYPLRHLGQGRFTPFSNAPWSFWVNIFGDAFIGHGDSCEAARQDWEEQVHIAFQEVYGLRPWQMDDKQRKLWELFQSVIDVAQYERMTPVVVTEVGCVDKARPEPCRIRWLSGGLEVISLAQMPPNFASYKPGQWFEAVVDRERNTGRLRRVHQVARIADPAMMPRSLHEMWQSLPTTAACPSVDWHNL